jgi:hypothetical protein
MITAVVGGTVVLALVAPARTAPAAVAPSTMRAGIDAALAKSTTGWNTGNLDEFMSVYLDAERTTYATKTEYLHGRAAIAGHYAPDFAPGATHDSLRLEKMEVDSLTPTVAQVLAFYVLFRRDSTTAHGPTSLIMQRVRGTWYIVHDHSG